MSGRWRGSEARRRSCQKRAGDAFRLDVYASRSLAGPRRSRRRRIRNCNPDRDPRELRGVDALLTADARTRHSDCCPGTSRSSKFAPRLRRPRLGETSALRPRLRSSLRPWQRLRPPATLECCRAPGEPGSASSDDETGRSWSNRTGGDHVRTPLEVAVAESPDLKLSTCSTEATGRDRDGLSAPAALRLSVEIVRAGAPEKSGRALQVGSLFATRGSWSSRASTKSESQTQAANGGGRE